MVNWASLSAGSSGKSGSSSKQGRGEPTHQGHSECGGLATGGSPRHCGRSGSVTTAGVVWDLWCCSWSCTNNDLKTQPMAFQQLQRGPMHPPAMASSGDSTCGSRGWISPSTYTLAGSICFGACLTPCERSGDVGGTWTLTSWKHAGWHLECSYPDIGSFLEALGGASPGWDRQAGTRGVCCPQLHHAHHEGVVGVFPIGFGVGDCCREVH